MLKNVNTTENEITILHTRRLHVVKSDDRAMSLHINKKWTYKKQLHIQRRSI